MTLDGIGILIAMILGFCGLFWRQSVWSSYVDKRIDDLRADLGGRMQARLSAMTSAGGSFDFARPCCIARPATSTGCQHPPRLSIPNHAGHIRTLEVRPG